ncbi:hypothetical protein [Bacillus piscicola]|nr:hypothetical protein [Bacillus piscicola]
MKQKNLFLTLRKKFEYKLGRKLKPNEKKLVDEMLRKQWRENRSKFKKE